MSAALPAGFGALAPWVEAGFAQETPQARAWHRYRCPRPELEAFYGAMLGFMELAIEHLNGFDLHAMPAPQATLLALAESFMEAAIPVERVRRANPQAFEVERMAFVPDYGSDAVPG